MCWIKEIRPLSFFLPRWDLFPLRERIASLSESQSTQQALDANHPWDVSNNWVKNDSLIKAELDRVAGRWWRSTTLIFKLITCSLFFLLGDTRVRSWSLEIRSYSLRGSGGHLCGQLGVWCPFSFSPHSYPNFLALGKSSLKHLLLSA